MENASDTYPNNYRLGITRAPNSDRLTTKQFTTVTALPHLSTFNAEASVLVTGHQYTGLDIVGSTLHSSDTVFYIKEPMNYFESESITSIKLIERIHYLMSCQFNDVSEIFIQEICESNELTEVQCTLSAIKSLCLTKKHRVINQPFMGLHHLKRITETGIHVVYVVRDPRTMQITPQPCYPTDTQPALDDAVVLNYCRSAIEDLLYMLNNGRFMNVALLRYEDLAGHYTSISDILCKILGVQCNPAVVLSSSCSHVLDKDAILSSALRWVSERDSQGANIEESCTRMMSMLGYTPIIQRYSYSKKLTPYDVYASESAAFYEIVVRLTRTVL